MDDPNRNLSPCGTQIEDIPSSLIIDILSRLTIKSLAISRLVCKSWLLLISDPLFVELHRARAPSYIFCDKSGQSRKFCCIDRARGMSGENFEFEANVTLPDSEFKCLNSSNGLLCLENCDSHDEIYVCNPILGEYLTIPILKTNENARSALGFCSRSNQFKVLRIHGAYGIVPYTAEIYTIGNGTRHWRSVGTATSCMGFSHKPLNTFLNGSIHWREWRLNDISCFNFESEQFGSLPLPHALRDRRLSEYGLFTVGVVDGCLCIYAEHEERRRMEFWMMKEYGVEESWTLLFSIGFYSNQDRDHRALGWLSCVDYGLIVQGYYGAIYNPSFISLQDVAKGEKLTLLSIERIMSKRVSRQRRSDLPSRGFFESVLKCFCLESWVW